jgi:integration host factor subunit alpha
MALTKETMINDVYNDVGLSKTKSRSAVENLFEIIKSSLVREEDVLVSGFGKFLVRGKSERRGRNPQTSEDLQLRARKVVIFKASGVVKNNINE